MTEIEPGVTLSIETVDLTEHARAEIETAREQGIDPRVIVGSHLRIARTMENLLREELRIESLRGGE